MVYTRQCHIGFSLECLECLAPSDDRSIIIQIFILSVPLEYRNT